jgi:hypothetical protein
VSQNIARAIKIDGHEMSMACSTNEAEKSVVGKPEGKRTFLRSRHR